jgi:hypothetical protein
MGHLVMMFGIGLGIFLPKIQYEQYGQVFKLPGL